MPKMNTLDLDARFAENREKRRAERKTYGPMTLWGIQWTLQGPNQALFIMTMDQEVSKFIAFLASFIHSAHIPAKPASDTQVAVEAADLDGTDARARFITEITHDDDFSDPEMLQELMMALTEAVMGGVPTDRPSTSGEPIETTATSSTDS